MFVSGIGTILLFSSSAQIYNDERMFIVTIIIGVTTFLISAIIAELLPLFSAIFMWSISIAFTFGTFNSMRLADPKAIIIRNFIYLALTLILNIVFVVITRIIL